MIEDFIKLCNEMAEKVEAYRKMILEHDKSIYYYKSNNKYNAYDYRADRALEYGDLTISVEDGKVYCSYEYEDRYGDTYRESVNVAEALDDNPMRFIEARNSKIEKWLEEEKREKEQRKLEAQKEKERILYLELKEKYENKA